MPSRRFNIAQLIPDDRIHGLHGFREVIETIEWGLTELGHIVSRSVNRGVGDGTNILFGFHALSESAVDALPPDTIVYNFEQMAGRQVATFRPAYHAAARRLQIWEYSERNLPMWDELNPARGVVHVPVGWAPVLARIPENVAKDIDVLFYGFPGALRLGVFDELCRAGAHSVFVCGLYGKSRDSLIARAKLVLNVNFYESSSIFEVVRVSYLLANAKAVVANANPDMFVESDLRDAVAFASREQLIPACMALLADEPALLRLGERGREIIRKRDIRPILLRALELSDPLNRGRVATPGQIPGKVSK
jgi:hypothetical protein